MSVKSINAYAKINLFLDIESQREDGYHNIISVMQSVSLHDTLTVEYIPTNKKVINISCSDPAIPLGEKNIAYKAADLFLESGQVNIHIQKNIPAAAGLAGGSTDAAAVLIALNELTGNRISHQEMLTLGSKIGADVPFCTTGGTKLTQGIGEHISDFADMPQCYIVIACLGEGVSTPAAYRALDEKHDNFKEYKPNIHLLEPLMNSRNASLKDWSANMFNIFESVVLPMRPMAKKVKDTMLCSGAEHAMMSGSGPSVFGIFKRREDAERSVSLLKELGANVHICTPMR